MSQRILRKRAQCWVQETSMMHWSTNCTDWDHLKPTTCFLLQSKTSVSSDGEINSRRSVTLEDNGCLLLSAAFRHVLGNCCRNNIVSLSFFSGIISEHSDTNLLQVRLIHSPIWWFENSPSAMHSMSSRSTSHHNESIARTTERTSPLLYGLAWSLVSACDALFQ